MTVLCHVSFFLNTETFIPMNPAQLFRRCVTAATPATLPVTARTGAMMVLAAGIGVWGAVLLAPKPVAVPPGLTAPPPPRGDTAAVVRWFGATQASIKVTVAGLIASDERGAALLKIDNGPVQAWRVGQTLASGVTLAAVERNAVVLDVGGVTQRIVAPAAPALATPGFVRVVP